MPQLNLGSIFAELILVGGRSPAEAFREAHPDADCGSGGLDKSSIHQTPRNYTLQAVKRLFDDTRIC